MSTLVKSARASAHCWRSGAARQSRPTRPPRPLLARRRRSQSRLVRASGFAPSMTGKSLPMARCLSRVLVIPLFAARVNAAPPLRPIAPFGPTWRRSSQSTGGRPKWPAPSRYRICRPIQSPGPERRAVKWSRPIAAVAGRGRATISIRSCAACRSGSGSKRG